MSILQGAHHWLAARAPIELGFSPETLSARAAAGSVLFLKGVSGIGKSKGIEACLRALGPCVINHRQYGAVPLLESQIVWLKVSCPEDRSLKSLCIAILAAVDCALGDKRTYTSECIDNPRATVGSLTRAVMQALADHHVGVLVVDELQNLFGSKGAPAAELLNFLLRVRDESGICLTLCGTYASLQLLQSKFRLGRRVAADGVMEMVRPTRDSDPEWLSFCEILWNYQWVTKPKRFEQPVATTLYSLTQGIRGLAVPLMMRAQEDAIVGGQETVTNASLRQAWRCHFSQLDLPLAALRARDPKALANWDDLCDGAMLVALSAASRRGARVASARGPGSGSGGGTGARRGTDAGVMDVGVAEKRSKKAAQAADADLNLLQDADGLAALRAKGVVGLP